MASNSEQKSGSSGRSERQARREAAPGSAAPRRREPRAPKVRAERGGDAYAATKREEREGRLQQARKRALLRLAVVVGALAVALAVLFALARSDVFAIQSVEVVGAKGVGAARVRSVAAIPPGTNLLRVDTSEIERRLKRDARIADVDVGRDFPHSLVIKVVERTPVALLDLGDTFWVLDGDGWVLEKASLEATTSLVVIRDIAGVKPSAGRRLTTKTLANSLAVLAGLGPELRKQVRAVSASTVDETAAITRGGVEIRFGSSDQIARKDVVARRILKEQAGRVVFIDVRSVDRPVWRGLED